MTCSSMEPTNLYRSVRQAVIKVRITQSSGPLSCRTRRTTFWSLNSRTRRAVRRQKTRELECFGDFPGFITPFRHSLALPPSLTPAAMKKLVEKRNAQFCDAVNESVHAVREAFYP